MSIEPFEASIPDAAIEDVTERLSRTRWPETLPDAGWGYGADLETVKAYAEHWRTSFDWRAVEAKFNAYEQGIATAEGERIHFLHAPSPEPGATPLLITHGWPGSVVEFLEIIEPLRNPSAHGGAAEDAYHVVCPHIPGYGFSGPTRTAGFHVDRAAAAIDDLMQQLGYARYLAQGGDWGAVITRRLAEAHAEHVIGAHFNMLFALPTDMSAPDVWEGVTPKELEAFSRAATNVADGTGYSAIQGTKPQTLAFGMHDSPVALLAWQLEKFESWSDASLEDGFTKDQVLANVALYWFTETAHSASRLYCESMRAGNYAADPWSGQVDVPVGYCRYPGEMLQTPRVWAERRYTDIVHWTAAPSGGHFAAFENPDFFLEDVRAFGRAVRAR
ncbi:MAG: epoxide hydrolase 1 [bacterium]|nr:epoxide hydrolase 1 [bacterium]